jgi:hypothetical protein
LFDALGDAVAIVERTGGDALEIGFHGVPGLLMGYRAASLLVLLD